MPLNVKRNTILLAAALAVNSCLLQLAAAVNSLTFVAITGISGLLGLGPAIFLASSGRDPWYEARTQGAVVSGIRPRLRTRHRAAERGPTT